MESREPQHNQFVTVTELAGDEVSQEQIDRLCSRYYWAESYCTGKDIVEVGCGIGAGLGYLAHSAKSVVGGDISDEILDRARRYYQQRVLLLKMDAEALPFANRSKDVILLFEAIYYLPRPDAFVKECARVLRENGVVLLVTANKDLYAFNPSPYSHRYFGIVELEHLFAEWGFSTKFFGDSPLARMSARQKLLQPLKQLAVKLSLIPKTMARKKLLKRFVFGKLIPMPAEVTAGLAAPDLPRPLTSGAPNHGHKVIFCEARLRPSH